MNVNNISIEQQVIIRSRIDGTKTWNGTIDTIDKENPVSDNNNGSYMVMGSIFPVWNNSAGIKIQFLR